MIGELTPDVLLMAGLGVGVVLSWMTGAFGRGRPAGRLPGTRSPGSRSLRSTANSRLT